MPATLLLEPWCACLCLAVDNLQTVSRRAVRNKVAAQLQRDPTSIKAAVNNIIKEHRELWQPGQEGDPDADTADAAGMYRAWRIHAEPVLVLT